MLRLTFPHMGLISIPVKTFFEGLGHEVIVPPPINKRTYELGVKHSPEFACLPFKINLGNFIEAFERGADTIVMAGGVGPCRFGYYAQIQKRILRDLGYDFDLLLLDPPQAGTKDLSRAARVLLGRSTLLNTHHHLRVAWLKIHLLDQANKLFRYLLPRVLERKNLRLRYEEFLRRMEEETDPGRLDSFFTVYKEEAGTLPRDGDRKILRVKIIGEIYMVLESRVNFHVEDILGEMGVEVHRNITISHWIEEHLLGVFFPGHKKRTVLLAKPYLSAFVGGHGRETVAEAVDAGINRLDGVIQILPFTCMPEIVAQSILPDLSRRFDLPVLTLVIDEHSGEAGMMTRLEAFVDLLFRKRFKPSEELRA